MIFDKMTDYETWLAFYEHKTKQTEVLRERESDLLDFIESKTYLSYVDALTKGNSLSAPTKLLVNKSGVGRKRVVYSYSQEERYILGMITFLLKSYDHIFAPNLYSFRSHKTAKDAFSKFCNILQNNKKYVYRVDISNYFNSINRQKLLQQLKCVLTNDLPLYSFFEALLLDEEVLFNNTLIRENKGAIPGAPVSSFFANLYLSDMDYYFYNHKVNYIRYSDDIIVLADTQEELKNYISKIYDVMEERELNINPDKEIIYPPDSKLEFLGFSYHNGLVDICDVSLKKIKSKLRRKTRALKRWADKKNLPAVYAAKALIKRFNQKFYCNTVYNELTWARWYFPVINTVTSLEAIDRYEVDCIRYLLSGTHSKGRFNYSYQSIKDLGFRSMVNEYYRFRLTPSDKTT